MLEYLLVISGLVVDLVLILSLYTFTRPIFVDESTSMLDSESRYLPVLSETSSGPSSPQVHREEGQKLAASDVAAKTSRVVANFACQQMAAQRPDAAVRPIKSTSHPKSHITATPPHSQSPVARTLRLESSNVLETAVSSSMDASSNRSTGLNKPTDVKRKVCDHPSDENGIVALASQYLPEKYRNTLRQIYGDGSERSSTLQSSVSSSDTEGRVDKHLPLVKDVQLLNGASTVVDGNHHSLHKKGKPMFV